MPLMRLNSSVVELQMRKHPDGRGRHGHFFLDGQRQIDFVLVYERPRQGGGGEAEGGGGGEEDAGESDKLLGGAEKAASSASSKEEKWRTKFLKGIVKKGLQLEEDVTEGEKVDTVFVKVHAPFQILCRFVST